MASSHKFLLLLLRMAGLWLVNAAGALREQKFAMEPQDQTAVEGSRVTLPCRVIDKSGILQWTKDDFGLGTHRNLSGFDRYSMIGSDEEGDYSLDIYPVTLDDDAKYQCQVSPGPQGQPGIRSHYATVTVLVPPDPPKIVQGDYLVTTEDREIELECISHGGKPAAEITWIDGLGNVLTDGIEYIVEELSDGRRFTAKSILKLTPRKDHHNTTFTCQAQNTAERTHRSAKLKLEVKYAPKVTVSILAGATQSGRIPEGAEVRLGCHADANPADVTYRWFLNDEPLIGGYTTEMVIHNATRKYHDAIVKCEVHNAVGKSEESETLDISYGPQFRTKPRSVQADLGTSVTLTCDVDGNPLPEISWFDEKHKRIIHNSPNLTLRVDQETAGRYFCKAHVPGFPEIGADATIYLKGPPSIVSHRTQFGIEGDNVRVECTIFSIPLPERIVWTFNGREIDIHDQDYTILEDPSPEGIKSTLVIRESQEKHFGMYNCSVTNPYGSDVVEINLMQQKNVPSIIIIFGVAALVILVFIVILVVFLCQKQSKKKPPPEKKQCKESDRSSNISDLKLDLRTGSSNSNVHCDMDYIPGAESETGSESVITRIGVPLAGPVNVSGQEIYRYSADYTEPSFPPKDGQNNNGYVPYVDYSRDYNPPMMQPPISSSLDPGRESLQSTRLQLNSLQAHQVSGQNLPLNDLSDLHLAQGVPNGGLPGLGPIDPRFSATYGNPYLRNPNVGLPTPNTANPAATPAPPPYSRDSSRIASSSAMMTASANVANTVVANGANGSVPQVTRLPNSPTSQYIVPNSNMATIKRGTMATHV
ncbi:irregular chiasm C-roughest protein isoform X2 [Tribolium castaneum]|uniref:Irregular chiasm C-roughest protein-like Protein n=1 Tax=Tribolium castaneum TaxID=7070 RepID=A0A139WKZ8_TRICA|nr:PREDICTED: irregular chiasm C-roughest protein isoform X2 [Tribolium castaneum]KYB28679.1 Irregular chiasm C-roughest protein-like Protein [Tribolium castaneum]|eukprot:XP_008191004.1 PREDICTED: irregular chiasm C-roughest protein isoform X2 [Tribolium castaneum]